jgi:hypothetical protein
MRANGSLQAGRRRSAIGLNALRLKSLSVHSSHSCVARHFTPNWAQIGVRMKLPGWLRNAASGRGPLGGSGPRRMISE